MKLLELSEIIKNEIGIDLFDYALSDIIEFAEAFGSVADAEGKNIIYFRVLTPKEEIQYYRDCYLDGEKGGVEDLDIEVERI